ncbi:MAG: RNA-splicing factor [Candelina submexicana]|nr:MAG: RNA-splicing factor [Candelina submexicana]
METPAEIPATYSEPATLFKKCSAKAKFNFRKRPATPPPTASDSESEYSSNDETGNRVKRRRKKRGVTASSNITKSAIDLEATRFAADRSATIESTNDATKQSNWYDENGKEELSSKNLLANYQSFIQKNPNAPSRQVGPVKAPTNIRTITVTDFAPDDYKQGWELDRDWEIGTKGKKVAGKVVASANRSGKAGEDDDDDDALLENIPFACFICKKPYTNPIVTKCGHYFCEACALQRYRKNPSCAICGAGTGGVFNGAKNLRRLLDKKRERAKRRREKAIENGEEISEDDDDNGEE